MLTELRREVQAVMETVCVSRKPALRRSDDPDALLATDLPLAADCAAVEDYVARMTALGWRVWQAGDWLLLDTEPPVPAAAPVMAEGEAGCCISLLLRHPCQEMNMRTLRAFIKAADSGWPTLERLCGQLHAEWSAALREHGTLPGGLLPYLYQAVKITKR